MTPTIEELARDYQDAYRCSVRARIAAKQAAADATQAELRCEEALRRYNSAIYAQEAGEK